MYVWSSSNSLGLIETVCSAKRNISSPGETRNQTCRLCIQISTQEAIQCCLRNMCILAIPAEHDTWSEQRITASKYSRATGSQRKWSASTDSRQSNNQPQTRLKTDTRTPVWRKCSHRFLQKTTPRGILFSSLNQNAQECSPCIADGFHIAVT